MIVPFLYTLDEYSDFFPTYLWVFYKFLDFARKNDYPIIAQEKFFGHVDSEHPALSENCCNRYGYELPNEEYLAKMKKYCIKKKEEKYLAKYVDENDAWVNLLKKDNSLFQKVIEDKIKLIITDYKNVDAIITWVWNPTLEKVCKKMNIKLIQLEISTIRIDQYNEQLGYFQFEDKYASYSIIEKFKLFNSSKSLMFTREEILCLLLPTERLNVIEYLYKLPKYKLGYAFGLPNDLFEKAYSKYEFKEIKKIIDKKYLKNEVLIRLHPAVSNDNIDLGYEIDKSLNAAEWLSKCDTIINNISNIGYEASLFGKKVINISDKLPSSFGKETNLELFEGDILSIEQLNYMTFGYYVPYDLMFNKDYIKWRLSEPTQNDIYNYHINYILNKKNISFEKIKKIERIHRLEYILKSVHNCPKDKINEIKNYSLVNIYNDFVKLEKENIELLSEKNILNAKISDIIVEKKELSQKYNEIENEKNKLNQKYNEKISENEQILENYNNLINSKRWKLINKICNIKNILKK